MRLAVFVLAASALFAATPAHALFRAEAPGSLRLVAEAKTRRTAPPPMGPLQQPDPAASPPTSDAPLEIQVDPHAGSFVGKEVGLGAAMVFGTDVACVVGAAATALVIYLATGSVTAESSLVLLLVDVVVFGLIDIVVSPLLAALGAYGAAPKEGGNNGLLGALLGAYAAQAISVATGALAYLGVAAIIAAVITTGTDAGTLGKVAGGIAFVALGAIYAALHYVGVPLGASFGIHWVGAVNKDQPPPPPDRHPSRLPTRPHEVHAQAKRQAGTATLVAFVF